MKSKFPKILIISEFFFGENTGGSILLKNLFKDYPKNKIFIIHEEINVSSTSYKNCFSLKTKSNLNIIIKKIVPVRLHEILIKIKNLFNFNGKKETNPFLLKRLKTFKPEMIYTILGNHNLMCFIKEIKLKLNIPLMTHVMDNMPANFENNKGYEFKLFKFLIDNSKTKVAINSKMADVFKKEFKCNFEVIHNGIDKKKIQGLKPNKNYKKLTYIGSVFKNAQLDSLVKISKAIELLNKKKKNLKCNFYFPVNQKNLYQSYFPKSKEITISSHNLSDHEYFRTISKSDLLILASNFDNESVEYYKYSWPAKMGSYLMSNVPIFINGPQKVYFVNNAVDKSWAFVDSSNSINSIQNSIEKILNDLDLRKKVVKNAINMSKEFQIEKIRKKFFNLILKTASQ